MTDREALRAIQVLAAMSNQDELSPQEAVAQICRVLNDVDDPPLGPTERDTVQ